MGNTNPQDLFADFYRVSLKATTDVAEAALEAAKRLREQQLASIKEALASHARIVSEIDKAKRFDELASVPAKLANIRYQEMIAYWNGLFQVASQSQAEVTRRAQAQAEQVRESLQKTLVGGAPGVSLPVNAVLQPLMDVASSAYALTARAAEEATKLAAAQLANASVSRQDVAHHAPRKAA